jgi:hypothetical protein
VGRTLVEAYQAGYQQTTADIIAYAHDDVRVDDPNWYWRVLQEFNDDSVGLVGFAGSLGQGVPWMYNQPFDWKTTGRTGKFFSNMPDAENHGERLTGSRDVGHLDGMTLFVRRTILDNAGPKDPVTGLMMSRETTGWPVRTPLNYYGYDYWLGCETRRQGYKMRMVGVACAHLAGIRPEHRQYALEGQEAGNRWLWDNYRDVLPYMVEG